MMHTLTAVTLSFIAPLLAVGNDEPRADLAEVIDAGVDRALFFGDTPDLQLLPATPLPDLAELQMPANRALAFDGEDDFVTVPPCEAMRYPGQGGWTVEFWVKPVVYPFEGEVTIVGQESVGVDARDPWSVRAHPTHFEWRVDDDQGRSARLTFDMALGVWQHLACVYDNADGKQTLRVYLDGSLLGELETEIVMESRLDPVYMGALWKHRFTGLIDEVRVWSKALDENAVGRSMRTSWIQSGIIDGTELRGWWAFEENAGVVAMDWSRHATHAVLGKPHEPANASSPTRVVRPGFVGDAQPRP